MSTGTDPAVDQSNDDLGRSTADGRTGPRSLRLALISVCAVAALLLAGTIGYLLAPDASSGSSTPTETSVDAGFARDMSTHHTQAVSMAGYTRDNSTDPEIELLAFDIETSQQFQIGQMDGWLTSWGLSRTSDQPPMAWMPGDSGNMSMASGSSQHMHMDSDGLMPGMATPEEVARLKTLQGPELDVYFLQLMLRHHQGGVAMANQAAAHAETDYVRDLAQKMSTTQSNEIVTMEKMLRERGASPLPPPS